MVMKAAEKIIDAITQLMEGYSELQESVEAEYAGDEDSGDSDEESDSNSEVDAAIITEMRAALEAVIDSEDYSPEEIASAVSSLTEALEEIDPDIFESEESGEEESAFYEEESSEYYEDDLDDDYEEFEDEEDLDDDDDDDEEEEEEEEDDEDD